MVRSGVVTLSTGGEPTSEDGDNASNLTVDFGLHAPSTNPELSLGKRLSSMEGTTATWQIGSRSQERPLTTVAPQTS